MRKHRNPRVLNLYFHIRRYVYAVLFNYIIFHFYFLLFICCELMKLFEIAISIDETKSLYE